MSDRCATCRFWECHNQWQGACRRHAPVPIGTDRDHHAASAPVWPATSPGAWCGDHEPVPAPRQHLGDFGPLRTD